MHRCPKVIAVFLLNERQKLRDIYQNIDQQTFANKISKTSEHMENYENQYKILSKLIEEKGVCRALGEDSIRKLLEK